MGGQITLQNALGKTVTLRNPDTNTENLVLDLGGVGFDSLKTTNGYQKLPSGIIIQWGTAGTYDSTYTTIDRYIPFPISFPTSLLFLSKYSNTTYTSNVSAHYMHNILSQTNSGFTEDGYIGQTRWFAIGY